METSAMPPLLLRNLITAIFIFAENSLHTLSTKYKLLQFIRHLIISFFLYFLRILPPLFPPSLNPTHLPKTPKADAFNVNPNGVADSGIGRALSQLLAIVNDVPVSSRKYEVVRSLAERIVDDNNREGFESLREVNRKALTAALERTLRRLENAALAEERGDLGFGPLQADFHYLSRALMKSLRYVGDAAWARVIKPRSYEPAAPEVGGSAEKLAAEVLWLAQKLVACGFVEEAVFQWASASRLAWLSLMAEPRLQGSMLKVSAFMFEQVGLIEKNREDLNLTDDQRMRQKEMKMKMMLSWLPLLCRAGNGSDAPVLSRLQRAELERIVEEMIEKLDCIEDQEKVLSLWLHHFTYSTSSDWPNLHECYARWCAASRKQLVF
ncbi:hypothetical protein QQ045_028463 [Rhodiola kirilowii]